jgi:hypothetical protein
MSTLQSLRNATLLARLVLVWLVLVTGVAIAARGAVLRPASASPGTGAAWCCDAPPGDPGRRTAAGACTPHLLLSY